MSGKKRRPRKPAANVPTVIIRDRETVLTVGEILERAGIGRATFYRWIDKGLLPPPIAKLSAPARGGNPPDVWDLSILDRIAALRRAKTSLPE